MVNFLITFFVKSGNRCQFAEKRVLLKEKLKLEPGDFATVRSSGVSGTTLVPFSPCSPPLRGEQSPCRSHGKT